MLVQLKSIASVIDTRTNIVYATYQKGGYDVSSGTHYTKLSKGTIEAMSESDKKTFKLWTKKDSIIEKILYFCKRFKRK